ncbi:MAG: hypothetical protein H6660_14145 [Ardenticatenaceae bacterium]|nr:hypothetical protein [Ardenticatenaceae bacterium]
MNKSLSYRLQRTFLAVLGIVLVFTSIWMVSLGTLLAAAVDAPQASVAAGHSPQTAANSISGNTGGNQVTAVASLIYDGSFEEVAEPGWTEYINTTWCETADPPVTTKIGDWSAVFTDTFAYDGFRTLWVGGVCIYVENDIPFYEPFSNSADQWIYLSPDEPILSFWYYAARFDPDSAATNDFAYVDLVNQETRIWELPLTQANNTGGWINVEIDLSEFAGNDLLLSFGNTAGSEDEWVGNVFFDYITTKRLAPIVGSINPENGGTLIYTDPQGSLTIIEAPPGAVSTTVSLLYTTLSEPENGTTTLPGDYANHAFELDVNENLVYLPLILNSGLATAPASAAVAPHSPQPYAPSYTFLQPLTFTIQYTDSDVSLIDENTLRVYYWSGSEWIDAIQTCVDAGILPQPSYIINPEENYIQLPVCHLTRFGLVGN